MKIKEIKNKLLNWSDFYGQDIVDRQSIENAKTKSELKEVLQKHRDWLEMQNSDALADLDTFMRDLELNYVDQEE